MIAAILILPLVLASGDIVERDASIEIILEKELEPEVIYDELVLLRNEDHKSGRTDSLEVNVTHQIIKNDTLLEKQSHIREINSFSSSGMGVLNLSKGKYEFCSSIEALNYEDPNQSNNEDCKYLYVGIEEEEENKRNNETRDSCNCELRTSIEDKILEYGESQSIMLDYCEENGRFQENITYWVEDLTGNVVKSKLNTTNPSKKTYTPRIERDVEGYLVKAETESCKANPTLFTAYKEAEEKEPYLDVSGPGIAEFGDSIQVEVRGFKEGGSARKIDISLEVSGNKLAERSFYVNSQETEFEVELPLDLPNMDKSFTSTYQVKAEGLGLKAEDNIFLKGKESKEKEIRLDNIYTRKRIFDGALKVSTRTKEEVQGVITLKTTKGNFNKTINGELASKEINITHPRETIGVELYVKDELVDKDFLTLELEHEGEEEVNKENKASNNNSQENEKSEELESNANTTQTFESEKETDHSLIIIVSLTAIILLAYLFKGKNEEKQDNKIL